MIDPICDNNPKRTLNELGESCNEGSYRYLQYNRDAQERSDDDEQHGLDAKVGQVAEKFQITVEILVLVAITRFVMRKEDECNCGHF